MAPIKAAGKYRQEGKTYVRSFPRLYACKTLKQEMSRLSRTETLSTFNSVGHQFFLLQHRDTLLIGMTRRWEQEIALLYA